MPGSSGCFGGPRLPKVTPITTTRVKPKQAVNSSEMVKLGTLDHLSAPVLIVRMPFVFSQFLDPKLMASSLASTLTAFPLFAGRLRIDADKDYAVELNGAGASFTIAKCDATLEDILPEGIREAKNAPATDLNKGAVSASAPPITSTEAFYPPNFYIFMPKTPTMVFGYYNRDVPVLHAQVTGLQGGGSVLAIVVPHVMADQNTCRTLLKSWSQNYTKALAAKKQVDLGVQPSPALTTSDGTEEAPPAKPVMVREILQSYAAPSLPDGWVSARFERRNWKVFPKILGTMAWHSFVKGSPMAVAYHVPAARLAELKSEASKGLAASGPGTPEWISTNDAIAARIRQVMAELPGKSGNKGLRLSADIRKRIYPESTSIALGNCVWSVALPSIPIAENGHRTVGATPTSAAERSAELGAMAGQIRVALNNFMQIDDIPNELRWLEDNMRGGSTVPIVFKNIFKVVHPHSVMVLSNWTWGAESYEDVQFGGGEQSAPVWHQPCFDTMPNTILIVPAGSAAPGGGVLVHISLHKKIARKLKAICPTL